MENPIIWRELRAILRLRLALVLEAAFLLTLCGLTYVFWPSEGIYSLAAERSRELFTVFIVGQLAMVALFSPAFAASALTTEKELGTFDLLYASKLSPMSIVLGKLVSCIGFLVIVVVSSVPLACLCSALGGVSAREIAMCYGVILATAVSFGALSLAISSVQSRSFTSVLTAYVAVGLLSAGAWVPSLLLEGGTPGLLRNASPFSAALAVVQPDFYGSVASVTGAAPPLVGFLRWSAGLTLVCVFTLAFVLSRPPRAKAQRRRTMVEGWRKALKRRLVFPFYLIDPLRRKWLIGDWRNPVFVKELRSKIFARPVFLIRGIYGCIIVSILLLILVATRYMDFSPDVVRLGAIVFQLSVVVFVAPALTAGAVTSEWEGGNYEMLRLTYLGPVAVIYGKLKAAFFFMLMLLLTSVPVLYALYRVEADHSRIVVWVEILVLTTLLCLATGLFWSAFLRTTAAAAVASYGTVGSLCVGTLLALFFGSRLSYSVRVVFLTINPFASAIQATTDTFLQSYDLARPHLVTSAVLSAVLLIAAGLRIWRYHAHGE